MKDEAIGLLLNRHVRALEFADRFRLEFTALRPFDEAEVAKRPGWLMLSVRNPAFTSRLVRGFCDYARRCLPEAFITVVDAPYVFNVQAMRLSEEATRAEIEKLHRIGAEYRSCCERAIRAVAPGRVRLRPWHELEQAVPRWVVAELRTAFAEPTSFRSDVLLRTREVVRNVSDARLPDYARFLIEELPVLMWLYYGSGTGVVDCYPGPNPELLWNIECGRYAGELPGLTALAQASPGLIYADMRDLSRLSSGSGGRNPGLSGHVQGECAPG